MLDIPNGLGYYYSMEKKETTSAYTLRTWEHPGTGDIRIYINHPELRAKVWFEKDDNPIDFPELHHRERELWDYPTVYAPNGSKPWEWVAERALNEYGILDNLTWVALLTVAN